MSTIVINMNQSDTKFRYPPGQIAAYLAKTFEIPLMHEKNFMNFEGLFYDTVFLVSGAFGYCRFRPEIIRIVNSCKRFVYIQNDYSCPPPSQIRKILREKPQIKVERWSNIPEFLPTGGNDCLPLKSRYINFNLLTWNPLDFMPWSEDGLMYYGSFRPDRLGYFEKYLGLDASGMYDVHISSTTKGMKKWEEFNPNINTYKPFDGYEDIQKFRATIYIEDTLTHSQYNSPANRFYECLSAGVAIIFDESCIGTMEKAGYDIKHYTVHGAHGAKDMLVNAGYIAGEQRLAWGKRDYLAELDSQLKELI